MNADVTLLNFLKIMIFLKIRLDLLWLLFLGLSLVCVCVGGGGVVYLSFCSLGIPGGIRPPQCNPPPQGRSLMGNDIDLGPVRSVVYVYYTDLYKNSSNTFSY